MPSARSPSPQAPMPRMPHCGVQAIPSFTPAEVRGSPAATTWTSHGMRSGNSMVRPTTTVPSAAGLILKLVHMRSLYDAAAPVLQPSPPRKAEFGHRKAEPTTRTTVGSVFLWRAGVLLNCGFAVFPVGMARGFFRFSWRIREPYGCAGLARARRAHHRIALVVRPR
jgi:hypothetical protein